MIDFFVYLGKRIWRFDVSPQALKLPIIDNYIALTRTLFAIEDIYELKCNFFDNEVCLDLARDNSSYFQMYDMLKGWAKISQKNRNGEMTKEEYDSWRYRYSDLDDFGIWHKNTSQGLSDDMVDAFKDKLKNI